MPAPFPGMDPYLEGYLWPDLHHRLATQISRQLSPRLKPRYVARLEIAVTSERPSDEEIHIMYPALETMSSQHRVPLTVPLIEMRIATVEVRDVAKNELVTSIEIISPANKHEPGLSQHRDQVVSLHRAGVHVMEIDWLRRGTRTVSGSRLQGVAYLVALTRATTSVTNVWPLQLRDPLPVVPVPLRKPDPRCATRPCRGLRGSVRRSGLRALTRLSPSATAAATFTCGCRMVANLIGTVVNFFPRFTPPSHCVKIFYPCSSVLMRVARRYGSALARKIIRIN